MAWLTVTPFSMKSDIYCFYLYRGKFSSRESLMWGLWSQQLALVWIWCNVFLSTKHYFTACEIIYTGSKQKCPFCLGLGLQSCIAEDLNLTREIRLHLHLIKTNKNQVKSAQSYHWVFLKPYKLQELVLVLREKYVVLCKIKSNCLE